MGWGPSNDKHMIEGARWAAAKADCTRRQVGAMIFDADTHVVSAGRNGSPPGKPGCASDGACPRGRQTTQDVAPGSSYDTGPGSCIAIHAEVNALARADWVRMAGGTLAVTDEPCDGCKRVIQAYPLARVIWPSQYPDVYTTWLIREGMLTAARYDA